MVKRRTSRRRNALKSLFASLFGQGEVASSTTLGELLKLRFESLEERRLLAVAQLYIPTDLVGAVGSTVTVPVKVYNPDATFTFTGGDVGFTYDSTYFTISNPRVGGSFGAFAATFNTATPGVVKTTLSNATGINIVFDQTYDLILFDFTVIDGAGETSVVNVGENVDGLLTRLFVAGGSAVDLDPDPTNAPTDASVDGLITIATTSISTNGPFTVSEGATVGLSGTANDPIYGISTFYWDLDDDGAYGETGSGALRGNETGLTPTYTANLNGPSTQIVRFRVINNNETSTTANTTITVENAPPTSNARGPYTVVENGTVALSGTGSDPGDVLSLNSFRWDLDGDGTFREITLGTGTRGIESGPTPTFNATGLTGGTIFTVTLRVFDGDANTDSTAPIYVISGNQAPVASAGGPYTVDEGSAVTLSASGSTDDSTPVASMTYSWDLDGDGTFGETGAAGSRGNETGLNPSFNAAGVNGPSTVTITVRATDSQGATSTNTATASITIANVAPTANAGGTYDVFEGQTVALSGSVSDPVDAVTFDWDLDGDTVFGETGGAAARGAETGLTPTFSANGLDGPTTFTVALRARDGVSTTFSTAQININNQVPLVSTNAPYTVNEGSSTTLFASGVDVLGDTLNYTWDLDGDGTFGETGAAGSRGNETGPAPTFNAAGFSGPAEVTITVRGTDGDGGSATATGTVTVLNVAPTPIPGGPYTVAEGSSTTLTGTFTDPVDAAGVVWDLDGDGNFGETGAAASRGNELGSSVSFSATGLSGPATVTVTLKAIDTDNETATATTSVVVTNVAPTASAGGPYTVAEGSATTLSGTGADPVDSITFSWDLDADGTFGETGAAGQFGDETGPTPTFNAASISGPHTATVTVTVTDANGASTDATTTVVVTNVAPTANAGGPYNVAEGSVVVLNGAGTDPVDPVTFSWDLDNDGTFGETGAAASRGNEVGASVTFDALGLTAPATLTVSLFTQDGNGGSATSTTTVTVTNSVPETDAGGPYSVAEGNTVALSGTGADAGGSVTLTWDLDGDGTFGETGPAASRGNEVGATPIYSAAGVSGPASITVTIRATDNGGTSVTDTAVINVANVAPTSSAGGPYTVAEGSATTLTGTGTDPVDSITFAWDLDNDGTFGETGAAASHGNEVGSTVSFNAATVSGPATVTVSLRVTDANGDSTFSTTTVTVTNVAPTANANGPYTVAEGSTLALVGTGSDPVDSLSFAWDVDFDDLFGEPYNGHTTTGSTITFSAVGLSGPESRTITLRVTDANGAFTDSTTTLVITNVAPMPHAGGPYNAAEGGTVGLSGTATDPVDTVALTWDLDGDGTFGETGGAAGRGNETGNNPTYNAAGLTGPATHTVTLRATDVDGLSATTTAIVTINNQAPTASAGGPYTVAEGSATGLAGTGSDAGGSVTLTWDLDNDGTFGETGGAASRGNETGNNPTFSAVGLSGPATITVTVRATDSTGDTADATTSVTVTNVAPTAIPGGPYTVVEGSATGLSGTGTDPVDSVVLSWDLDGDGTFGEIGGDAERGNETGNNPSFNAAGLSGPHTATITLRATDANSEFTTATTTVIVTNAAPTAFTGGPYSVAEGDSTTLTGSGTDPVDSVNVDWDLDGDGIFGETGAAASRGNEAGASVTFNAAGLSGPATVTVTVRATDDNGASSIATTTVTVTNIAPTAIPGGPYTVTEGGATGLSGTGTDPVDNVTLAWDLDGDTTFGETGGAASRGNETGSSPTFSAAGVSGPATRTITLRATDSSGVSSTSTTTVIVTNAAPTASAGGPYTVAEGGATSLSGTGSDPVDSVTLSWDLDGDGTFGETGGAASRGSETGNTPSFSAAGLSGPATITITVCATDADGASSTATTTVIVTNTAPTANAGGPYTVAEGSETTLSGTGTDPVDAVTLTWDLDGDGTFGETGGAAGRGNETGNNPSFNAPGLSGPATVTITVRATDNNGASTDATTTVTVTNVAPTASAGGPYNVPEGGTISLSGTATDPVDPVTLLWDLDGDGTFGETGAGATRGIESGATPVFNAAGLSGSATVTVTLRAIDSNSASSVSTTTVSVANSAPTAEANGPYTVAEGSTTTLSGTGSDAGGSVVLSWDLDGDGTFGETGSAAGRGNETGNSPSFNAAGLNGPTTVTVTLRVTDTSSTSTFDTATVAVTNVSPSANAGGPYTVAEGSATTLNGTGADPVDSVDVEWDLDGDGTFGETGGDAGRGNETGNNPTFSAAGLNGPTTVTVTIRATDIDEAATSATTTVIVTNVAPTANAGGPYNVPEGNTTTLSGTGADPVDGVALTWDLDNDGIFGETGGAAGRGNETGNNPTFNAAGLNGPATVTITVRATDDNGASTNATTTVIVTNVAPTANAGGPYTVAEGSTTGLSGTGTDPVDSVVLAWDLDNDGVFGETGGAAGRGAETGASPIFAAAGLNGPTTATITLRATDANGASSLSTATVVVTNVAPTAEANGPYTVVEGGTTGLSGTGADPVDSVVLTWDLDGDGTFGETGGAANRGNETGNSPTFNAAGVNGPNTVVVTVRVSDGATNTTDTALVIVNNAPPTASSGGPYTVAEGSSTTLNGTGTDPVDGVKLTWDLDGDGTFGETGGAAGRGNETGANPSFNAAGLGGPATITITVRATDCDLAVTSATTTVVVTNVAPDADAGGPYSVAEGGTVQLNGTGTDPVDAVTLQWDLDGDGIFGETGAGAIRGAETGATPTFNAAGIPGPAVIPVTLRVVDANGASATDLASIGISNVPPTAEAGGPYTVSEGATVQLSGTGSDSAGSVVLAWDLDGDGTFGETGGAAGRGNETGASPIFSPTGLNGPTSVIVTVRATDTSGDSTTDTATVIVTNAAPTASAGGPYTVTEGGTTTLTGTGSDLSGSVSLDWDLDGDGTFGELGANAARGNEMGNSPTYNAAGLDGPTVRTVTVRATDNDGDATLATALVAVTNVAPTVDAGGPYSVSAGGSVALTGVGGPTFSDPGVPDTHTAVWDLDGDGIFGETGAAAGRGNETGLNPTFVANNAFGQVLITLRVTDDDGGTADDTAIVTVFGAQFDFNHDTTPLGAAGTPTPTQAGYTNVLTRDTYTSQKGFGWNAFTQSFDRGAINTTSLQDMRRDGHYGTRNLAYTPNPTGARTFRADVPNGVYAVNVTMGDNLISHDNMQIRAEMGEASEITLPLVSNLAGQFTHTSFTVQVTDGHLDLEFSDQGGNNQDWVLNGIEIRPSGIDTIVFAPPGDFVADGVTPKTFTATVPLPDDTLVTVTTSAGTIITPDADPALPPVNNVNQPSWSGIQVKVIGGQITFAVTSTANTPVTVNAVAVNGLAAGSATAVNGLPDLRRFDFNATVAAGGSLINAPGFTSVIASNTYNSTAGFGWVGYNSSIHGEFQRNGGAANSAPAKRDGHFGSGAGGRTFQIVVTPNVQYNVRVYVGDYMTTRTNISVTVEGATPYTMLSLPAGSFDTRTTMAPLSASDNGLLTINIRNTAGGTWVANGIDIWEVGTPDPGAAALQAAEIAAAGADGAALTSEKLAPLVTEAITRWTATGLNPVQVAALQATQFQIVDLGDAVELGNAQPGLIQIDDDAAGHGWFIDSTPDDDDEFALGVAANELQALGGTAAGRMDLLTLIMHELGHELGVEGSSADRDPHDLMTEKIDTGVRRTPAEDQAAGAVPPIFTTPTSAREEVFASLSAPVAATNKPQAAPTSSSSSVLSSFFASSRVSRPSARQKPTAELPKEE